MKVVAINGSPHKEGNTYQIIKAVTEPLENQCIETEVIHVGNKNVCGCTACEKCKKNKDERCTINDEVNEWIQKMKTADGIILGSPVHFSGIAGIMKCFLDRAFNVAGANSGMFRHKVGASVVAVRRSGGVATFDQLNHYFSISEMLTVHSNYWNVFHGEIAGEVLMDKEGMQVARILGENMAWLLKVIDNGKAKIFPPAYIEKIKTNFIRY